jgi:hypothetical protein
MNEVLCTCCGQKLVEVPERSSQGLIASQVVQAGFRAKNAFLYTGRADWFFFCSIECNRSYYLEVLKIPQEKLDEMSVKLHDAKERCLASVPQTTRVINALVGYLKDRTQGT